MELRNKVKEIVIKKFGLEVKPTSGLLLRLKTNKHRFKQIIENKGKQDMTAPELKRFSEWLDVSINDLLEEGDKPNENVKSRSGLS